MNKLLLILTLFITSLSAEVINFSISSNPSNLDPFFSTDSNSQNINRLLHLSLVDFDKNMKVVCSFCKKMIVKKNKDGMKIRFKLKENQKFWDGSRVDAFSVKNSVELFQNDTTIKSIFRFAFNKIDKVIIYSKYDVELSYKGLGVDNLPNLVLLKILKVSLKNGSKQIIGAGPFKLNEQRVGKVSLKEIGGSRIFNFFVVSDEVTLALKLINKEIDVVLNDLSVRKKEMLKSASNLKFNRTDGTNIVYLGMNFLNENLKDRKVREALSYAVPIKDFVDKKLKNSVTIAGSLFSPSFKVQHDSSSLVKYRYDVKKAAEVLRSAGYVKKDGYYYRNNKLFKLVFKVPNKRTTLEYAKLFAYYIEKFGVKTEVITLEWGSFLKSFKNGLYDIVVAEWVGLNNWDMLKYAFHSSMIPPKGGNRGRYINSEFDRLYDLAEKTLDDQNSQKYFLKAQKIVGDDLAYLFLWHPEILWITQNYISGITPFPNGSFLGIMSARRNKK